MWVLGSRYRGTLTYSVTFLLYAIMITSGLIVHCVFLVECGASKADKVCMCACMHVCVRDCVREGDRYSV